MFPHAWYKKYIPAYSYGMRSKILRGFTLIELLVVIAIIGILAGIVLAAVSSARGPARDARRISDIRQITYALAIYYSVNGRYPCSLYSTGSSCPVATTLQGSVGTTMKNPPKDPTGIPYSYAGVGPGGVCSSYHLGVALEDKKQLVLQSDADAPVGTRCALSPGDFSGRSATAGGVLCNAVVGAPQPGGTETCYDVVP